MRSQPADLPPHVLDAALGRLLDTEGNPRATILAELVAAHPEHAEELRTLDGELRLVDRLLSHLAGPRGRSRVMRATADEDAEHRAG